MWRRKKAMTKASPRSRPFATSLVAGLAALAIAGAVAGAEPSGTVTHLSGTLAVKRADGSTRILSQRSEVHEGDLLVTAGDSYARVKFVDGSEVTLRPDSQFQIETFKFEAGRPEADSALFRLIKGGLRSVTGALAKRNRDNLRVITATATVGIRGTIFGALQCANDCGGIPTPSGRAPENGLHLDVSEGSIVVTNNAGSREFTAGQFGYVQSTNSLPAIVPQDQAPKPPAPPERFEAGRAGVGKAGTAACTI